eukprot:g4611.t1
MATAKQCKIPMHDFTRLDYDLSVSGCNGIWAAPLWLTPDKWQWGPGSGEIDSTEFCSRDSIHLNFAGGGHQVALPKAGFSIDDTSLHITIRKDSAGIVTTAACTPATARHNGGQCGAPRYSDCADCLRGGQVNASAYASYACWCS